MDDSRLIKLNRLFDSVIQGKAPLSKRNHLQFLEAVCSQNDAASCLSKIITSNKGLSSIQDAMRIDLSIEFFNGAATQLLIYVSAPELAKIAGGNFLHQVLTAIVDPPIFWTPFLQAFQGRKLQEEAQFSFAWLLFQLISLQGHLTAPYHMIVQDGNIIDTLNSSSNPDTRSLGQKIKNIVESHSRGQVVEDFGPGGRHDNDFNDFRQIAILPTADEILSQDLPFLRQSAQLEDLGRLENLQALYLDNQFRLLREDMLYELREEVQTVLGKKRKSNRNLVIDGLTLLNIHYEPDQEDVRWRWGITLQCRNDLPQLNGIPKDKRKAFLQENRTRIFRHQSMTCLLIDGEVVAFPILYRDEDLLARQLPCVVLQLEGEASTIRTLMRLKTSYKQIKLLQIDTALFAYEPILKSLQEITFVPLSEQLLFWKEGNATQESSIQPRNIVRMMNANPSQDLRQLLKTSKSIKLDQSQAASFILGLSQTVSLIQGPPGTGKSFIGALLAKTLHDFATETILVVCYTNHALDQFLEDLLDIGIPGANMVRLGGKSTTRTGPLSLHNIQKLSPRSNFTRADWHTIDELKGTARALNARLKTLSEGFRTTNIPYTVLLEYLEFEDPEYYAAFEVPQRSGDMVTVGKKGRAIEPDYLLNQWTNGWDAGALKRSPNVLEAANIWGMSRDSRRVEYAKWRQEILKDQVNQIHQVSKDFNKAQDSLNHIFSGQVRKVLKEKRIIGCTTTAAAKYREQIKAAEPGVVLVEEAGEILESHILTALGEQTKQLILIGDHKQLRPKVNNYLLTIEKGEGYDLNRSLFERLALKGYPHEILSRQHRMRPEISRLIRLLTYPDLEDAENTNGREDLRGVRGNIVFIDHDHPEDDLQEMKNQGQMDNQIGSKSSKQNRHEVEMVLSILRYLGQQGYRTETIVILTPYLGQLRALQQALKATNDPILNDLDSADLVRAGLISHAAAKMSKKPIRIATIDNYQGEESDIVIASLTRSNNDNQIGFMSSPQRVNVLLSRARNALIMIGNSHTFLSSRSGKEVWGKLFELLKQGGHIYDGFPVKCERHPDRTASLKSAYDFDNLSPDGGCTEPCVTMLNCGVHLCTSKCHQIVDHSKMDCEYILYSNCPKGHRRQWKCHKGPPNTCANCEEAKKRAEKKKKEEFELQEKRDREQRLHSQKIAEIESKISQQREILRDAQLAQERDNALKQKEKDLTEAASMTAVAQSPLTPNAATQPSPAQPMSATTVPTAATAQAGTQARDPASSSLKSLPPQVKSQAGDDWQHQKRVEGVTNDAIDAIMEMTGLEEVKQQVLRIKAAVDTAKRQGTSLKEQRFNVCMLGNPGTGKTTIARLYGKFLASVQVLPGNAFIETTGSRLADDGVPGTKKKVEEVLNAGGGAFFVDEAYQLVSQNNPQGRQVLDFLLAEMENQVGKVAFILAGYNREMEKFFEHNPGLSSRVPYTLQFKDYEDDELLTMLERLIKKAFSGRMKVEGGVWGLYTRIAVSRLGRGRGRDGFGNARALHNMFFKIRERQGERLTRERRLATQPDDFLFVKEDIIGPNPSQVMIESSAWKKLQDLIGLGAVKKSIANLFHMTKTNYDRELLEKVPLQIPLNRVFLGSPGTGKTSVAKLYGQILADLGLISNGEVVTKNPADFIGAHLGQSESQTKAILAATVGKVLIIDEAYMLYGGKNGSSDPYKTAVIDTIVAEVQSVPGEDRCVLLLGYKHQIEEMCQNVNPGLSRRFAIEDAFYFHDYTNPELRQALELKLKQQDLSATDGAKDVAVEVLSRARNRPNFGNIGEVENLLTQAKNRFQARQMLMPLDQRSADAPFEPQDFDPEFDRGKNATTNLANLFKDIVGCKEIINKLAAYQRMAHKMKQLGKDPRDHIPTNFIFKGPPGTGKTTTARKMGQVYYDMGFLSSIEVVECSASDLVGQYVGHTGPKTKQQFEKALGKVLFIDEAYRLAEGRFAKEAMDEIVGILTQETFRGKLVVVLAGYDQEMNELLAVNPGLASRFPDEIIFRNIPVPQCLEILKRELEKQNIIFSPSTSTSTSSPSVGISATEKMTTLISELSSLPAWGNARDVNTLAKQLVRLAYEKADSDDDDPLNVTDADAISCMQSMLAERRDRQMNLPNRSAQGHDPEQIPHYQPPPPPSSIQKTKLSVLPQPQAQQEQPRDDRDPGVSDQIWTQLQADKLAEEDAGKRSQEATELWGQKLREAVAAEELANSQVKATDEQVRSQQVGAGLQATARQNQLMKERELQRLRAIEASAERARITAAIEARRKLEEMKRKEEAIIQAKLRIIGHCVAGFRWIKQASGYRCAGGSHFVDNATLGI